MMRRVGLVDGRIIWIPNYKSKLHTTCEVFWWVSICVGVFEVKRDEIDIIAIGEEENAPMVSARYTTFAQYVAIPRMSPGFKNRAMISPWMIPPILYLPVVYLCVEDRRLFYKGW